MIMRSFLILSRLFLFIFLSLSVLFSLACFSHEQFPFIMSHAISSSVVFICSLAERKIFIQKNESIKDCGHFSIHSLLNRIFYFGNTNILVILIRNQIFTCY